MKHILMVDDVTTNLKVAAQVLEPYYELSMAKSGKQALTYLKKNRPDLILLDIKMPEMDGYQTMEEIKLNPETADIPIIFLTADTEHESEIKGLRMGALDFITKPFEEAVMLGRIEKVLQMEELRKRLAGKSSPEEFHNKKSFMSKAASLYADKEYGNLILMDLDGFSALKKAQGEEACNSFINTFTKAVSSNASNTALCGNMDGDMFMFYLKGIIDKDATESFYNDVIIKALEEASQNAGTTITASVGVCQFDNWLLEHDFDALYNSADKALYFAKMSGKNRIHFFVK